MNDEMSVEEMALYKFRVKNTRFEELADAIKYAQANLYADRVDFLWPDGVWRVIWQDGDIEYNRPGFGCLVPYKRSE